MPKEFQKSALPTLFHFVKVKAAYQSHVSHICSLWLDAYPLFLLDTKHLTFFLAKQVNKNKKLDPFLLLAEITYSKYSKVPNNRTCTNY